ncbi:hypothetical protein DEIPH_ctg025orf0136 [Deinococcus phoenicis]|uniref:Uncharacterized protein n=1 Tax=Deinococcus phoenicis TaxID=1476583 RepID=A0A016QQW5_9DEIO|nr:hypothetical protein [Deinococcus phoenicis]EYB68277.1 hypothetical protein DEIPH_ctg025orf0136 [Deinococcus phoenicis]
MKTSPTSARTDKGVRGFDLDLHVTFARPLARESALAVLRAAEGFTVDLYAPHGQPDAPVPSARLTGPLRDPEAVRAALRAWLQGEARMVEVGLHGFLRSSTGQTDWMPWRRNVVLPRADVGRVAFEEGVKYVLE